MMHLSIIILLAITSLTGCLDKETDPQPAPADPVMIQLEKLNTAQKVGQLVIVGMEGTQLNEQTRRLIEKYHVGGFIFYRDNIQDTHQALSLFNDLKRTNANVTPVPLWMSVDEEGGRVSRLPKEFLQLPSNQAIGQINDVQFSEEIGRTIGGLLSSFGLNMIFAPVLDVNSNPNNPVIGERSFGNDAKLVSKLGIAAMEGIRSEQVVPVIKHFPGHGDTSVDSHLDLPVIDHDMNRLRALELVPFADAIERQADAVMIAHLLMPELDPRNPATFSKRIITDLLREELGFQGVVISDDMAMGAIDENYDIGATSVQAILAGANIVLIGHEDEKKISVIEALNKAVNDGTISKELLDDRVYAILKLKQAYGITDDAAEGPDIESFNNRARSLLNQYGIEEDRQDR